MGKLDPSPGDSSPPDRHTRLLAAAEVSDAEAAILVGPQDLRGQQNFALYALRVSNERAQAAQRQLLHVILDARELGITFQQIADTMGISKHWAWKLHARALREGL